MNKREAESLDEEYFEDQKQVVKRERKSYSNCYHATKSGMRCLNTRKHGFKIGPECYDFCKEHFHASLLKLFSILTGPIEVSQSTITGPKKSKFDLFNSLELWNLKKTRRLIEITSFHDEFIFNIGRKHFRETSIESMVDILMATLEKENGFYLVYFAHSENRVDSSDIRNKVYGYYKGDLVIIPVDVAHITPRDEEESSSLDSIRIEVEVQYIA
jgi:hypothetical protein